LSFAEHLTLLVETSYLLAFSHSNMPSLSERADGVASLEEDMMIYLLLQSRFYEQS
jgi:hypothetical protein